MGGNKDDKRKQAELKAAEERARLVQEEDRRTREADRLAQQQLIETVTKPDPHVTAMRERDRAFLDSIRSPDFDVTKSPDLAPYVSLNNFGEAAARQEEGRQGKGLLQMGLNATNPALVSKLAQQSADRRGQQRGGLLERAFAQRYGEATGSTLPTAQFDLSRNMGAAGLGQGLFSTTAGIASNSQNAAQNALNAYSQFQVRPGFLQQLAMAGLQGAAGVAGSYFTGGFGGKK